MKTADVKVRLLDFGVRGCEALQRLVYKAMTLELGL